MVGYVRRRICGQIMLSQRRLTTPETVPDLQNRLLEQTSSRTKNASWEATMEPVHVSTDGSTCVHDDDVVVMSTGQRLTKVSALLGYVLAEYVDGDEAKPTRTDCVDKYAMDAMHKHLAYTSKVPRSQRPPDRTSLSPPRSSRQNRSL
jgi:hypothetical protein